MTRSLNLVRLFLLGWISFDSFYNGSNRPLIEPLESKINDLRKCPMLDIILSASTFLGIPNNRIIRASNYCYHLENIYPEMNHNPCICERSVRSIDSILSDIKQYQENPKEYIDRAKISTIIELSLKFDPVALLQNEDNDQLSSRGLQGYVYLEYLEAKFGEPSSDVLARLKDLRLKFLPICSKRLSS